MVVRPEPRWFARARADGFLLKDVTAAQLVEGARVVAAGEAMLAPTVTRRLLERFAAGLPGGEEPTPPSLASLTGREREILTLLASGLSNAELGAGLYLSEPTIKTTSRASSASSTSAIGSGL